jgi:hypothetical protein|tara:strand:- start:39 stop:263 length:225 start_codon:yes stop_codon:yes gene_type:complete
MSLLKLTNKEIQKRIDKIKTLDDIGKLYFDMFEEYPPASASWDAGYPEDAVWNAIMDRKPIKPDKRLENTYIKF